MESHKQACKCIIIKTGEKKLTPLVLGNFKKVNFPTTSAVIIFSPYTHAAQGNIHGSWRWYFSLVLIQLSVPSAVCCSIEMHFAAAKRKKMLFIAN